MSSTKIGILIDFVISDNGNKVMYDAMNLAFDEALEHGLLDRSNWWSAKQRASPVEVRPTM